MKIIHFCAGLEGWNGMANTARQFVAEELARGDESQLTNDVGVVERTEKIDRVHIHGTWLPVLWKVARIAKRKGAELIVRPCGNYDPIRIRRGAIKRLKKWLVGPFEHAMLDRADFVQCTCAAEAEWVKAYHPKARIQMTDLKRFFDLKGFGDQTKAPLRGTLTEYRVSPHSDFRSDRLRTDTAILHLLYLGRRHPLKGVEFLEQAVEELKNHPHSNLNWQLELRCVSNHFGEELEQDWDWCDVLVLPTLSENFGRVVAEALERGKFVITTDGAPAWEPPEAAAVPSAQCPVPSADGRLFYLKGYRNGTDEERVKLLKDELLNLARVAGFEPATN